MDEILEAIFDVFKGLFRFLIWNVLINIVCYWSGRFFLLFTPFLYKPKNDGSNKDINTVATYGGVFLIVLFIIIVLIADKIRYGT